MTNLSQVSLEAMYSTTYVENYIDCVENLPDDLQRILSRLRELDCTYRGHLRDVEQESEYIDFENISPKQARSLQKLLIHAQEVGDEKLQLVQQLQDLIDYRTRKLEVDYKNLDLGKEEIQNETKESQPPVNNVIPVATNTNNQNNERQSKRARRTRQETLPSEITPNTSTIEPSTPTEHLLRSSQTAPIAPTPKKTNTGTGKKKKRKARGASAAAQQAAAAAAAAAATAAAAAAAALVPREDSPAREDENAIDPDEPTYCLCDQISFGEMILCDNDLCPIEWFHFSCVALTTKPKGKWFCPKCRGDRPNVMKPKAQFLKELERYNKEKEEKT